MFPESHASDLQSIREIICATGSRPDQVALLKDIQRLRASQGVDLLGALNRGEFTTAAKVASEMGELSLYEKEFWAQADARKAGDR